VLPGFALVRAEGSPAGCELWKCYGLLADELQAFTRESLGRFCTHQRTRFRAADSISASASTRGRCSTIRSTSLLRAFGVARFMICFAKLKRTTRSGTWRRWGEDATDV
jgi:hypothetical protein